MTNAEIDCVVMGFAGGVATSAVLLAVRNFFNRRREDDEPHAYHVGTLVESRFSDPLPFKPNKVTEQDARELMTAARKRQIIPLGPFVEPPLPDTPSAVNARGHGKITVTEVRNPLRDEVIAALVGVGFKKVKAIPAVDACTLAERVSVETWTVAALQRAST